MLSHPWYSSLFCSLLDGTFGTHRQRSLLVSTSLEDRPFNSSSAGTNKHTDDVRGRGISDDASSTSGSEDSDLASDAISMWLDGLSTHPQPLSPGTFTTTSCGSGPCFAQPQGQTPAQQQANSQTNEESEKSSIEGPAVAYLRSLLATAAPIQSSSWGPLRNHSLWIMSVGRHARNGEEQESLRQRLLLAVSQNDILQQPKLWTHALTSPAQEYLVVIAHIPTKSLLCAVLLILLNSA